MFRINPTSAQIIYSDAWTERHNQSESYVINAAKNNHTIYHKGKGSLGIDNYTHYMLITLAGGMCR